MARPRLAVAAGNRLGAHAAARVAELGGNAVDACIASAVMAWVAEPFFASVGGSGFVAVRTPDGDVEVIDGNNAMPLHIPDEAGAGMARVFLDYSNGMYTGIGGGSVAVPGILAGLHRAWERHGRIEWAALFDEAITAARNGLDFPRTSAYYLSVTWEPVWSRYETSMNLFSSDGRPLREGEALVQAELAESLRIIADEGPGAFYEGQLAAEIVDAIVADGGVWQSDDLQSYTAEVRVPVAADFFGWKIDSNPPPAVGGAVLTHMLAMLSHADLNDPVRRVRAIVEAERDAIGYRRDHYEDPGEIAGALQRALGRLGKGPSPSAETTHGSAADSDGFVCSITESNGYGAGLVVHGMLLNNTLGEEELVPVGPTGLPPGARCNSNMTPTVATGPGVVVGLGSPGADRITGAVAQTVLALAVDDASLTEAVAAPRVHLAIRPDGTLLCFEPGLPGEKVEGYLQRPYEDIHMFFGGVQAASVTEDGTVEAAHDPRRSGASALI